LNKAPKSLPPGAAPKIQGYYACALFNEEREAPDFHKGHTAEWKKLWLSGYDEAKR